MFNIRMPDHALPQYIPYASSLPALSLLGQRSALILHVCNTSQKRTDT